MSAPEGSSVTAGPVAVTMRTSSMRLMSAAGLRVMRVKGWWSGSRTMDSMVPTGSPRGKTRSPPEVRTLLAGLYAGVGGEVVDDDAAGGRAAQDGVDAGGLEDDSGAGGGVVDEEELRGEGEDVAELADDSVGGDDGHVGVEAVVRALVEGEDARAVGAGGADDLGGDGLGRVLLAEGEEGLEALAFERLLGEGGALETELRDLVVEVLVLLADEAEVEVVVPGVADAVAGSGDEFFEGQQGHSGPEADEPDGRTVGACGVGAVDLRGESDRLREQDGDEDEGVLEAAEKGVHGVTTQGPLSMLEPRRAGACVDAETHVSKSRHGAPSSGGSLKYLGGEEGEVGAPFEPDVA